MRNDTRRDWEFEKPGICNVAAAIIGSAVIGGVVTTQAAKSAAGTQAGATQTAASAQLQATREANALTWQMYQQNLATQSPFLRGGQTAYAALLGGMGLGSVYGAPAPTAAGAAAPGTAGAVRAQPGGPGGLVGGDGRARPLTAGGAADTAAATTGMMPGGANIVNYGATPEQLAQAATQYGGAGGRGVFTERFTPSSLTMDPSYQFRLDQGLQALRASRAATGMLQTGQGLKDITNYAQQAASQEYQAAFDRYMTQQREQYNRLASLAGVGQTTAGGLGTAGQQAASTIGAATIGGQQAASQYLTSGAAAQAAGTIGAANALTGAAQGGLQNWMTYQLINRPSPWLTAQTAGGTSAPIIPAYYDVPGKP
jgi:hypothetical protein